MGKMNVSIYIKGDYDNKPACGIEENKAKQSQFQGFAIAGRGPG